MKLIVCIDKNGGMKKLEKEYVTDNQSLITDSNFAWGSLD